MKTRLFDFRSSCDIFDVDNFLNRGQFESSSDFVNHVFARSDYQNSSRLSFFDCCGNFFSVTWQYKNCAFDCHDSIFFFFCRCSGDDFSVFNQNSVVDDSVCIVFVCNDEGAMTFSSSGCANQCDNFHRIPPITAIFRRFHLPR